MIMHYLSHPYSGDEEKNRAEAEALQRELQEKFPKVLYVSPIANFKALKGVPYGRVMKYCLELLSKCDGMTVTGRYRESKGCMSEIAYAQEIGIPIFFYDVERQKYIKEAGA